MKAYRGTNFNFLIRRLEKEMTAAEIQALYERDGESPECIACLIQIPVNGVIVPAQISVAYHHLHARGMGGGSPNQLPNLCPLCHQHHQEPLVSFYELLERAMVMVGKANTEDYGLEPWLYPLTQECLGFFGYGTANTECTPVIQKIFVGKEDARLNDFCLHLCPLFHECIEQTRVRKYKEIAK